MSDKELEVTKIAHEKYTKQDGTLTFIPKIEYSSFFSTVWYFLSNRKCVVIFPEGGSHDQSNFLPFKKGVSIMSLGYLSQFPESDFYLIPVGMNYFKRESFRQARAFIDVGEPIPIDPDFIKAYSKGGKDRITAVDAFLSAINHSMVAVTTMAPNWSVHNAVIIEGG